MKNRIGVDRLLDDLVAKSVPDDRRAAWLETTLAEVRRRNRNRKSIAGAAAMIGTMALGLVLWRVTDSVPPGTHHLYASFVVHSRPLQPSQVVQSRRASVRSVSSTGVKIAIVATPAAHVAEIDDQELLNLVAGKPAALVRSAPDQEELVFSNPEDAAIFGLH